MLARKPVLVHPEAAGSAEPRALPMQILDMASGYLLAFGAQAALLRQRTAGGSWHVKVSLARTAQWLRELGRMDHGFEAPGAAFDGLLERHPCVQGELMSTKHAAQFSHVPPAWPRPSAPPGTDVLAW